MHCIIPIFTIQLYYTCRIFSGMFTDLCHCTAFIFVLNTCLASCTDSSVFLRLLCNIYLSTSSSFCSSNLNVQIAVGFCLSHEMLSDESESDVITQSNENGVLPMLEIKKNLQILFSNQTSQVCVISIITKHEFT